MLQTVEQTGYICIHGQVKHNVEWLKSRFKNMYSMSTFMNGLKTIQSNIMYYLYIDVYIKWSRNIVRLEVHKLNNDSLWRMEGELGMTWGSVTNTVSNLSEMLYFLKIWSKVTSYKHLLVMESEYYRDDYGFVCVCVCIFTIFFNVSCKIFNGKPEFLGGHCCGRCYCWLNNIDFRRVIGLKMLPSTLLLYQITFSSL